MIRINLADGRRNPDRAHGADRPGPRTLTLAAAVFALALTWSGGQVLSLRESVARVARETASAESELRDLAPRARRLAALEARRTQLSARAAVVAAWRADHQRVARLLEQVGHSVPAGVRLAQLQQDADGLLLGGQAVSVAAVSELAAELETLEQVLPPVEIVNAQGGDAGAEAAVRFEIRARLAG